MPYCSLKFGKTGEKMSSLENSSIQTIVIPQKIYSNSKYFAGNIKILFKR
jgi:hypothetical protein